MSPRKQPESLEELFQTGSRYPFGIPNAERVGTGIDLSIGTYLTDQSDSIAEVARRLGRPRVSLDADGYEIEIAGGTVNASTGEVAWVESRSKGEDIVDVTFRLYAQRGDSPLFEWELATYNPYFGCHPGFVRFYGDEVALTYREKHDQILAVVGVRGARLIEIGDVWLARGDDVLFLSRQSGLIECRRLPSLEPRLPFVLWPHVLSGREAEPVGSLEEGDFLGAHDPLADDPEALARDVATLLFPSAPEPFGGLVVGAIAHRFWDDRPRPRAVYAGEPRWGSPEWLPFYLAEHFQGRERDAYLELLRRAAMNRSNLATTASHTSLYVAWRLSVILKACKERRLPTYACGFWYSHSLERFRNDVARFPKGFRDVFALLEPQAPRWLELSRG